MLGGEQGGPTRGSIQVDVRKSTGEERRALRQRSPSKDWKAPAAYSFRGFCILINEVMPNKLIDAKEYF